MIARERIQRQPTLRNFYLHPICFWNNLFRSIIYCYSARCKHNFFLLAEMNSNATTTTHRIYAPRQRACISSDRLCCLFKNVRMSFWFFSQSKNNVYKIVYMYRILTAYGHMCVL